MPFLGRISEIRLLEEFHASLRAELFVLSGRRRVGKTELLKHFCEGKDTLFFTASQVEHQDNLNAFVSIVKSFFKDPLLEDVTFKNFEGVFSYLAEKSKKKRLLVVLDEFPYWVMGEQALPSLLQRFWDEKGKASQLMLILCGSSMNMMEKHVLAEKSPLYGRRTGQLTLEPFSYREAGTFFKKWSQRDKLLAYGVLGGIPAYLAQFDPLLTLKENIQHKILRKGTFLSEEVRFLLQTELREPKTYASLLRAISAGKTKLNELSTHHGPFGTNPSRKIASYLSNLQALHLVKRKVSFTEPSPKKNHSGRYYIQDHFLNFWFRFVEPNITLLETGRGVTLYQEIIQPQMDHYMGKIFETICQQYLLHHGEERGLPIPKRVGQIWGKNFDVDVVSENLDKSFTLGACKWSSSPLNPNTLLHQLEKRAEKTPLKSKKKHFVLFSSAGFKKGGGIASLLIDQKKL